MSTFSGTDVNDDIFTPEFSQDTDDGQGEGITEGADNQDLSPEAGNVEGQEGNENVDGGEGQQPQGQPEEDKLYAGKFKSVEELERAYQNLQPSFTKVSQELSQMRKQVTAPQVPQPVQGQVQQPVTPQQTPTTIDQFRQQVASQVFDEYVAPLNEQVEAMKIETELAKMATRYDDFKEVAPKMMDVLRERPNLLNVEGYLDIAFALAQKEVNAEKAVQQINSARQEAYKNKEIKVLNNDGKPKARQPIQEKSQEQSIVDDILSVSGGGSIFRK